MITEIISYTEALLRKYRTEISPLAHSQYILRLRKIQDKKLDSRLHLAVIGEFSTGKSTFINALLRDELLESNVLQGTTTVNSVIEHGDALNMLLYRETSESETDLRAAGQSELSVREQIKSIHRGTDARSYSRIVVKHPSEFLQKGIVVIDTPGTNTPDAWHEEITQTALNELADTAIVLTAADQPLPDSLVAFVKENLGNVLNRCIFLVTKTDIVRARERDELLEYVKQSVQRKLGIEEPIVLPYAPLLVLEEKTNQDPTYIKKDREDILIQSYQTEVRLFEYVQAHKEKILQEKLLHLLGELLTEVKRDLENKKQEYQRRSDILKANTKKDPDAFMDSFCTFHMESYCQKRDSLISRAQYNFRQIIEKDIASLHELLYGFTSQEQLKTFSQQVGERLLCRKNDFTARIRNAAWEIVQNSNRLIEVFVMELNREYGGLNALLLNERCNTAAANTVTMNDVPNPEISITGIETDAKVAGGAVAGAAIGSALLPGIGTILGGFVGAFLGSLFGPDLNTLKSRVWSEAWPQIKQAYEQMLETTWRELTNCANQIGEQMCDKLDKHMDNYIGKIERLRALDEKEQSELQRRTKNIAEDERRISDYQMMLV